MPKIIKKESVPELKEAQKDFLKSLKLTDKQKTLLIGLGKRTLEDEDINGKDCLVCPIGNHILANFYDKNGNDAICSFCKDNSTSKIIIQIMFIKND